MKRKLCIPPLADEKAHKTALERVRRMTPQEVFESSVTSGIHTPDGELTPPYQGREVE